MAPLPIDTPLDDIPPPHPIDPPLVHETDDINDLGTISEVAAASHTLEDRSKFRQMLTLLRSVIGIKEIYRMSLPASVLEPIPNLEYWHYMDRPDFFCQMNEPDDDVDRFLAVLRWWFSKDLKHVHGKPCKPYNSVLGEGFRCWWDVEKEEMIALPLVHTCESPAVSAGASDVSSSDLSEEDSSDEDSFCSARSGGEDDAEDEVAIVPEVVLGSIPIVEPHGYAHHDVAQVPSSTIATETTSTPSNGQEMYKVTFVNEQISHHPPVSAFVYACQEMGITARGVDHLAVSFNGTSVKVASGDWSDGVFIALKRPNSKDEEYHLPHCVAFLNGWLRGNLYISVVGQVVYRCRKTNLKCVVDFKNEKWTGKLRGAFTGKIIRVKYVKKEGVNGAGRHKRTQSEANGKKAANGGRISRWFFRGSASTSDVSLPSTANGETKNISEMSLEPGSDTSRSITPNNETEPGRSESTEEIEVDEEVVGTLDGSWRGAIWYTPSHSKTKRLLVDLTDLRPLPKQVKPIDEQAPWESRRVWQHLTDALLRRDWSTAQVEKHKVEEEQRRLRKEREERGEVWEPRWIELEQRGKPRLKCDAAV